MLKIIVLYLVINLVAVPAFNFSKVIGTPVLYAKTISNFIVGGSLYLTVPELLGTVEHIIGSDLIGNGSCRIDNVKSAKGDAVFVIGEFLTDKGKAMHIRGFNKDKVIENTCIDCELVRLDAILKVRNYQIEEETIYENSEGLIRNMRYLKGALFTDRILKEVHL